MDMYMMMLLQPISPALQRALEIIAPILMVLMVLLSIALIIIVLAQSGNTSDVSALSGGGSNTQMGKNKIENKATRLKKYTYILGAAMLLTSVAYFVLQLIGRQ